jgi:hypothetical protein
VVKEEMSEGCYVIGAVTHQRSIMMGEVAVRENRGDVLSRC